MESPMSTSARRRTIHFLPDELLSLIFADTLLPHAVCPPTADSHPTIAFVARTCALWRSIALRLPILWTQIHYYWPSNIFQLYVQRSKVLPLTIYVTGSNPTFYAGRRPRDCDTVVASKFEHVRARAQHLHFRAPALIPTPTGKEAQLQAIHLTPMRFMAEGHFPAAKTLTFAIDRATLPQHQLNRPHLPLLMMPVFVMKGLPRDEAKNIRILSLLNVNFYAVRPNMLACFGALPGLEELELEGIREPVKQRRAVEKVELAALRTLKLTLNARAVMEFLMAVKTPRVTEMEYALLGRREGANPKNYEDRCGEVDSLLLGAKAQVATIERAEFDALELSASFDGICVQLSGPTHHLKVTLPGIAASDAFAIIPLLAIPSSSQIVHLHLHATCEKAECRVLSLEVRGAVCVDYVMADSNWGIFRRVGEHVIEVVDASDRH